MTTNPAADSKDRLRRLQVWLESLTKNGRSPNVAYDLTVEEAESALRVTSRIINGEEAPSPPVARSVVACLDPVYGDWGCVRVNRDEIPLWEKFGFTPQRAQQWTAVGLTLEDVPLWHAWTEPEDIVVWKATGIHPDQCQLWAAHKIKPDRAKQWREFHLGYDVAKGAEWLNAFPLLSPQEVHFLMHSFDSAEKATPWVRQGVPPMQARQWKEKRYTPLQASALAKRGVSVFEAPYLFVIEALPGREWKKVARRAQDMGWQLLSIEQGWTENEKIAGFYRSDERANFRFRGKRFVEAWQPQNKKTRYSLVNAIEYILR